MRDAWWTTDPATGQPVRVLAADDVAHDLEQANGRARDAERQVDVMQEAAARIRPRLRTLADQLTDSYEARVAREEIAEIAEHIRAGCPPDPTTTEEETP